MYFSASPGGGGGAANGSSIPTSVAFALPETPAVCCCALACSSAYSSGVMPAIRAFSASAAACSAPCARKPLVRRYSGVCSFSCLYSSLTAAWRSAYSAFCSGVASLLRVFNSLRCCWYCANRSSYFLPNSMAYGTVCLRASSASASAFFLAASAASILACSSRCLACSSCCLAMTSPRAPARSDRRPTAPMGANKPT